MRTNGSGVRPRQRSRRPHGRRPPSQPPLRIVGTILGAILALLAGLLALAVPAVAATPADPPATPVNTAAATGNVTVDPTFAAGQVAGVDTTALARQSDGKILVAGWFTTAAGAGHFGLRRLQTSGLVDPSFDAALRFNNEVAAMAVQSDGKILVGGRFTSVNGQPRSGIARLNANGTLDAGFNPGAGFLFSQGEMVIHTIAVTSTGQVLVGGAFDTYQGKACGGLVRLHSTGSLDASFVPYISGIHDPVIVNSVTLQPDGKILIGGRFTAVSLNMRGNFARLNSDGTLDHTITGGWGFNGDVLTIAMQTDGKIVVGGAFDSFNTHPAMGIVRLDAYGYRDGGLKANFTKEGGRARVTSIVTSSAAVSTVVGDFTECDGKRTVGIAGFTTSGSGLENFCDDASFFNVSILPTSLGGRDIGPSAIGTGSFLADVLAAGRVSSVYALATVRRGEGLSSSNPFPLLVGHQGFDGPVAATAVQSDGKILVGGEFRNYNGLPASRLVRLNSDGTLDLGFDARAALLGPASNIAVLPDGTIAVVWGIGQGGGALPQVVCRLLPNGAAHPTFTTTEHWSRPGQAGITSLVAQPDGRLLLGGTFSVPDGTYFAQPRLTRLKANGGIDTTFNQVIFRPSDSTNVGGMLVQPDGRIVAVGSFTEASGITVGGIVRVDPSGQPDQSFAASSGFEGTYGRSDQNVIVAQPDGKLVVGGNFTTFNGVPRNGILRLNPDGVLDTSFNPGSGFQNWGSPSAIVVQPDGKLLATGVFTTYNGSPRPGLLRLNSSGSLDTGFDPGGGLRFGALVGARASRPSLSLLGDGKLLISGSLFGFNDSTPPPSGIAKVAPPPPTVPGAPTIVHAVPDKTSMDVGFIPPLNDGGLPLTNYEYAIDNGPWVPRAPASVTSPVHLDGLNDGQTYQVRLRAVNPYGPGNATEPATVRVGAPQASALVTTVPTRVSDSRLSSGGSGPIPSGASRIVSVAAAQAGGTPVVPAGAVAVAYNVTVPEPGGAGHVRVMPGDTSMLTGTSAINFRPGETIANAAVVKVSPDRSIKVHNGAGVAVDVIVDVVGYFVPQAAPGAGSGAAAVAPANGADGLFTAVTPVRVYDAAADPVGNLAAGADRLVSTATTQDGATAVVPVGASAVAYSITVTDTVGAGHLRVMPGDVASTPSSAVNWAGAGERIANGAVVQVDAQRRIRVYNGSGAPVRFLIDVVGYYSATGQAFYPIDPVRTTETRYLFGGAGPIAPVAAGQRSVSTATSAVGGLPVVPAGATAAAYNATVVGTGSPGHLRVYPTGAPLVGASALNWPGAGYTRANASIVGVSGNREVTLYNGASTPTDVLIDVNGYYK